MLSYTVLKQSFSGERSRARGLSCSNYAPGVKNGSSLGSHILHMMVFMGKHEKI